MRAQQRGMQIVNMHAVFDGFEAELVGRAMNVSAFDAAAGQPGGEAVMIVVAATHRSRSLLRYLDSRRAAEFTAANHKQYLHAGRAA